MCQTQDVSVTFDCQMLQLVREMPLTAIQLLPTFRYKQTKRLNAILNSQEIRKARNSPEHPKYLLTYHYQGTILRRIVVGMKISKSQNVILFVERGL